ncbi:N-acetylmuramoyl-L-alanine amidase CwlD [Bacillus taeanensis]|uniref:N-acetylmuramoyl-L-alanine amidase CwlD n=1 Tax=Bacillus taeanensis TaxID=273032 RepID=A0A366XNU7_9BACI|nr:N-acetylmuramoyl-L-alanine amidase CwlD [Bacillus taeanensis]RBW67792.1 N-acetylmuramoyl-L-alanine amidase CwlD [Bacillus taeanensis]
MKKHLKAFFFLIGIALFLIIVKYQFLSDHSWSTWSLPLTGKVIVIDAGHGGPDGGAVGKGDIIEKDIALDISLKLRHYLEESGALVVMTREKDTDLADADTKGYRKRKAEDLRKRVEMINEEDVDLFISIHLNAVPSPKWSGAQTFYNPSNEESETVSRFIQDEIRRNLENTARLAKKMDSVYLLRNVKTAGALVEVGFLSHPTEKELLNTKNYQNKIAASIYQGILRHYTDEEPPQS